MAFIIGALILLLAFSIPGRVIEQSYTVRSGDTLYVIARQHGLSWQYLAEYNNISDPTQLWVGTKLSIPSQQSIIVHTPEEQLLLARLIHAEARGESLEGQIAVGAVVINRVKSPLFPNTIKEVVHQPRQFSPIEQNSLPQTPVSSAVEAASRALAGEDPSGGAIFFYNPRTARFQEYWDTRPVIKIIGNHNFAI